MRNTVYTERRYHTTNVLIGVAAPILLALVMTSILLTIKISACEDTTHVPTTDRAVIHRIPTTRVFNIDCIEDDVGYFGPIDSKLLYFFVTATGIQPYINVKMENATLSDGTEKDAYAQQYYDRYIKDRNGLMVMYFAEPNNTYVSIIYGSNVRRQSSVITPLIKSGISRAYEHTGVNKNMFIEGLQYVLDNAEII